MSKPAASLLQRLSSTYKTKRFPWKKHALIGHDLNGNEYWDCPNPLGKHFTLVDSLPPPSTKP